MCFDSFQIDHGKIQSGQGDVIGILEAPNGFLVTPYDEKKSRQLDAAREIMRKNRNMLKKLAE